MSEKTEALRLADDLEMWTLGEPAAAELRRLSIENDRLQARYEACRIAAHQWLDKTEWVQETAKPEELGMHRADVMRQRLVRAETQRDALLEALAVVLLEAEHTLLDATRRKARAAIKAVEEKT